MTSGGIGDLVAAIKGQPSWSDLPVVLLLSGGQEAANSLGVLAVTWQRNAIGKASADEFRD